LSQNNSFSSEISKRYALALYELSQETNLTDEFITNITSFKKILNTSNDLKSFIKDPTQSTDKQQIVFKNILDKTNYNKMIKSFFSVLISKKRVFFIDNIVDEFLKLVSKKKGEISGNLILAKKIDGKNINDIEIEISKIIKRTIKLKTTTDEKLIGGLIIQIGSLMIDASIKNKLLKYKKLMSEA
tara:strand:- start:17163 stop:17720 length:558 start_codon:yes stop_codon:yes gene_type:complete